MMMNDNAAIATRGPLTMPVPSTSALSSTSTQHQPLSHSCTCTALSPSRMVAASGPQHCFSVVTLGGLLSYTKPSWLACQEVTARVKLPIQDCSPLLGGVWTSYPVGSGGERRFVDTPHASTHVDTDSRTKGQTCTLWWLSCPQLPSLSIHLLTSLLSHLSHHARRPRPPCLCTR